MLRRVFLTAAFAVAFVSAASAATVNYTARLSGVREVPKTDSKGSGHLNATFDTTTKVLTYTLTFQGLTGPATAAHLHGPAPRGQNAGVLIAIGKDVTSPTSGKATLTDDQVTDLTTGKMYVNVHTAANPNGEIRGQVVHASKRRKAAAATKAS
ncbi:CHRD domain-containing protein [Rhodopila sp.]|uniref:CHRD domain-containing protein n=1 Tax=Rhodopila sp. TaxID=2480087 RepID=UPI003D115FD4